MDFLKNLADSIGKLSGGRKGQGSAAAWKKRKRVFSRQEPPTLLFYPFAFFLNIFIGPADAALLQA